MRSRWLLVALTACGSRGAAPTNAQMAAAKAQKRPACVTPPEAAVTILHASTIGTRVQYCIGSDSECFALDVATGAFERIAAPKDTEQPRARIVAADPKLDVCSGGQCKSLTPSIFPTAATLHAATNSDGTFAVVLLGDAPKGKGYAEIWDVTKTKKAATFRYASGDFRCGEVAMLDDKTIFVSAAQCGQPAARGGLYKLDGRKIANVGGKDFGTYGRAFVQVDGTTWAFLEENGGKLAIQDIAKGKVTKTIDTSLLFKDGGAEMGNPGESALVKFVDGKLGVIAGAPATGSVATVDVASGEIAIVPAPQCKPEPAKPG